jgi:hypothetical protein
MGAQSSNWRDLNFLMVVTHLGGEQSLSSWETIVKVLSFGFSGSFMLGLPPVISDTQVLIVKELKCPK